MFQPFSRSVSRCEPQCVVEALGKVDRISKTDGRSTKCACLEKLMQNTVELQWLEHL